MVLPSQLLVGSIAANDRARRMRTATGANPPGRLPAATAPRIKVSAQSGRRILYPTTQAVAELVAGVARGEVVTTAQLCARLAGSHGVDECSAAGLVRCLQVLAGIVAEDLRRGRPGRWPIWRVTNDNGQLHGNWPLNARWRAAMLRDEGQVIRHLRSGWAVS
jgi:alkylated DNA nucleotide flippase Atl1